MGVLMSFTNSPNMSLPVPAVGSESGPQYAYDINTCLSLIDSHDHSPGKGVLITPNGLNINQALSFNSNSATNVSSLALVNQVSNSVLNALYAANGELWFNDTTGAVQITAAGSVNATSSSLASGNALASFAAGVLTVYSNSTNSTPANIQAGSLLIGNPSTAGSTFLTLQAPATPSGTLTLPTAPGSGSAFMVMNSSGVMSTGTSTAGGIVNSNLASMAANTFKGNNTGAPTTPVDMTATQALTLLGTAGSTAASNGYTKLPGGIIIQWLSAATASNSGGTGTNTNWPLTFPNNIYSVVTGAADGAFVQCDTASSTKAHCNLLVSGGNSLFNVIAIGN